MSNNTECYELEKIVWTEEDYDDMDWHDCVVYGFAFGENQEFLIDLDYLFKWLEPDDECYGYRIWKSPCTLVFENVSDLKIHTFIPTEFNFEIVGIYRGNHITKGVNNENNQSKYAWTIKTLDGRITFKSSGYKQYVKQEPILTCSKLSMEQRKGISFDRNFVK